MKYNIPKSITIAVLGILLCSFLINTSEARKSSRTPVHSVDIGEFPYDHSDCSVQIFYRKNRKTEEPFIEINYKDAEPENAWCDLKFRNKNIIIPGLTYNPLDKNYYYEAAGGEVYQCTYRARYLLMKILKEKNCKIDVKKNWGNKNREDSLHINLLLYK